MLVGAGVDELRSDSQSVAGSAHRALEDVRDAQLTGYLDDLDILSLVRKGEISIGEPGLRAVNYHLDEVSVPTMRKWRSCELHSGPFWNPMGIRGYDLAAHFRHGVFRIFILDPAHRWNARSPLASAFPAT